MPTKTPAENIFLVAVRRGNILKQARSQTRNGRNNESSELYFHNRSSTHVVLAAESIHTANKRTSIRTSYCATPKPGIITAVDFQ